MFASQMGKMCTSCHSVRSHVLNLHEPCIWQFTYGPGKREIVNGLLIVFTSHCRMVMHCAQRLGACAF
jgi:hypothetical protein